MINYYQVKVKKEEGVFYRSFKLLFELINTPSKIIILKLSENLSLI